MTPEWPEPVSRLIDALEWRAEELNKPHNSRTLAESCKQFPPLLLLEGPGVKGWNTQEMFAGFSSMVDFLANALPGSDNIPVQAMCLVTIGHSRRPHLVTFKLSAHSFDVFATAKTIVAYYEGKESLPRGLTDAVPGWISEKTIRTGYGDEGMERDRNEQGMRAIELLREAICSVSEISEFPIITQIFSNKNFAFSSYQVLVVGRATRLFCKTFCQPGHEHFNEVLAAMFEWKARDLLANCFVGEIGYKYGLESVMAYDDLPGSEMVGALAHLPELPALCESGPMALER